MKISFLSYFINNDTPVYGGYKEKLKIALRKNIQKLIESVL